ncbi:MAG: murein biosynthesis integral membrane protein MurJ [Propioniciclava sp.]
MAEPVTPPAAASRRLLNATAVMASGTMISRVLGFLRAGLLVIVLGSASPQADAFSLATLVPNSLYMLFAGGALNTVLVPQIVRHTHHDDDGGQAFINRIITAFVLLLAAVTVLATIFTPQVMSLWSSSEWRAESMAPLWRQLVFMATLTMPQLFFFGVFFLLGQVLNARDKFGPMMWAPILNNVVAIAVLGLYLSLWGTSTDPTQPFSDQQVLLLGIGSTLGIVLQTAALIPSLRATGLKIRPRFDLRGQGLGETFHLAKWMLGYVLLTTVGQVVVTNLVSAATAQRAVPGAGLTAYNTAYLVWILPHSLLTVALATAMLPSASRLAAAHDLRGVAAETVRTMRLALTFLVPASVAFLVLGLPFMRIAFGHGANAETWQFLGWTLMAFALGLVPYTIQYVYLRGFYALEDTRTPFLLQGAITAVNIVAALVLANVSGDPATVAPRLALAYALSYLVGAWLTHVTLAKRLTTLSAAPLVRLLTQLFLAVLPGAVVAGAVSWWTREASLPVTLAGFAGSVVVAGSAFFGMARLMHIPEATQVLAVLRRRAAPAPEASPKGLTGDPETTRDRDGIMLAYPDPRLPVTSRPDFDPRNAPGDLLDGRYRLDEPLSRRGSTVTWRAFDLKLGRPVLLHMLDPDDPRALDVLDQARRAAPAIDNRFLRVWDAVLDETGGGSYVVCEYAPGRSLELLLRDGPLSDLEAAWLVRELASGLAGMHDQGLYHRALNPDTVIVTATGNPKIVGFLVEHALHPDSGDGADPESLDVTGLGELLYASLTGRWPGPAHYGLRAAATDRFGRPVSPAASSTRVSVEVSDIADRILARSSLGSATPLTTAVDVAEALSAILGGADAAYLLEQRLQGPIELVRVPPVTPAPVGPAPGGPAPASAARLTVTQDVQVPPPPRGAVFGSRPSAGDEPVEDDPGEPTGALHHREDAVPASPWSQPGEETTNAIWADVEESASVPGQPFTPIPPPAPRFRVSEQAPSEDPSRRWIVVLACLFVLSLIVGLVGVFVNQYNRQAALPPTPAEAYVLVGARDFDPEGDGGDGRENPDLAALTVDGNTATAWTTERYGRSATFNDRKPGAGVVVDLGEPKPVSWVVLTLGDAPTGGEIRVPNQADAAEPPMDALSSWRQVTTFEPSTGHVQLHLQRPVTTRFVLVYLTSLPRVGSNYQGTIAEIAVTP